MQKLLAVLVILLWGMWGFLFKVGIMKLGIWRALFWSGIAYLGFEILIILYLIKMGIPLELNAGSLIVFLACFFSVAGSLGFLMLLEKSKASVIVPLTALYPAVTVILGMIILKEKLSLENAIGILLAITAGYFLSR